MLTPKEIANFDIDPVIRFCYDFILPISEDRVLATHGGEISLITKDGDMLCTYDSIEVPTYESERLAPAEDGDYYISELNYIDDMLLTCQDGKWGLIDYDGDIILDPVHTVLRFIGEGKLEVLK